VTQLQSPNLTHNGARPSGLIVPADESAARVLSALEQSRLKDARSIDAVPNSGWENARAWVFYLKGMFALERREFASAESRFMRSIIWIQTEKTIERQESSPDTHRLMARALHQMGCLYRRQDRPADAARFHLAAYRLRDDHGSYDEMWESALNLGIDHDLASGHDDARRWYDDAISLGTRASHQADHKQAIVWARLSGLLASTGDYAQAVDAARKACDSWHAHDTGSLATARADLDVGYSLLKWGESLHGKENRRAEDILTEARNRLCASYEALLAFGPSADEDVRWCDEQRDFAERLLASLES